MSTARAFPLYNQGFYPVAIPPGVVALPTKQMSSSNWAEVNLVRWREGSLMPMGGQQQYNYSFASRCKAVHTWYDLNQVLYIAYLCEANLYVDMSGVLTEITPSGGMTGPAFTDVGFGGGDYGAGIYGGVHSVEGSALLDKVPDAYSLDNFGAVLLAMTSPDGRLLQWDPSLGLPGPDNLATLVVADEGRGIVPTGRCFVVTTERFVMVFGAYDADNGGSFRRFAWCDQENYQAWDYSSVTSQAGFLDIEPSSPIICAMLTRNGTLFWTGKKAYISQFLGLPYVYNYTELANNCTPWSSQSMVNTSSMALWFSEQGLFSFDGTSILPIACNVRRWVDADIDIINVREQACACHVASYSEFWWFFPQLSTGTGFNTRAIIYNYKEGWWSQAQMARSAGITAAYNAPTIMANGTIVYEHELLNTYSIDAALPYAETFDLNISPDQRLITVKQMIPDIDVLETTDPVAIATAISNLQYVLFYRNSRSLGTAERQSPPALVRQDGFVDLRTTGRDIRLRFEVIGNPVPLFTLGNHLVDAVPRGDR
jgi:hypothetical protein